MLLVCRAWAMLIWGSLGMQVWWSMAEVMILLLLLLLLFVTCKGMPAMFQVISP